MKGINMLKGKYFVLVKSLKALIMNSNVPQNWAFNDFFDQLLGRIIAQHVFLAKNKSVHNI